MTSNGVKLLNYAKPITKGFFAVFKEKGDSIQEYQNWIKLTLYHESRVEFGDYRHKDIIDLSPRHAEPFVTGVVCVSYGNWCRKLLSATKFLNHEWLISGKLGIETQLYSYDSRVVNEMPFNHITEDMVINSFESFIGSKEQLNPPKIETNKCLIETDPLLKENRLIIPQNTRIRECHSIELICFDPPFFKLKVITDGLFSCRSFIHDLGIKLNSCAHLTHLHLERMGSIHVNDCLKKHELHLNNIYKAIEKYTKICSKDLEKLEKLMPDKRRYI